MMNLETSHLSDAVFHSLSEVKDFLLMWVQPACLARALQFQGLLAIGI